MKSKEKGLRHIQQDVLRTIVRGDYGFFFQKMGCFENYCRKGLCFFFSKGTFKKKVWETIEIKNKILHFKCLLIRSVWFKALF